MKVKGEADVVVAPWAGDVTLHAGAFSVSRHTFYVPCSTRFGEGRSKVDRTLYLRSMPLGSMTHDLSAPDTAIAPNSPYLPRCAAPPSVTVAVRENVRRRRFDVKAVWVKRRACLQRSTDCGERDTSVAVRSCRGVCVVRSSCHAKL